MTPVNRASEAELAAMQFELRMQQLAKNRHRPEPRTLNELVALADAEARHSMPVIVYILGAAVVAAVLCIVTVAPLLAR